MSWVCGACDHDGVEESVGLTDNHSLGSYTRETMRGSAVEDVLGAAGASAVGSLWVCR